MARILSSFLLLAGMMVSNAFSQEIFIVKETIETKSPLRYEGNLYPLQQVLIRKSEQAHAANIYAKIGESVHANQPIIEWAAPELLNQFYQANRDWLDAQEQLNKLENWGSSSAVKQAIQEKNYAQQMYQDSLYRFEQTKKLYSEGIISKEECLNDKRNVEHAKKSYYHSSTMLEQTQKRGRSEERELAQVKHNIAKQRYELLKKQVDDLLVKAPFDGILLPSSDDEKNEIYGVLIDPTQWKVVIRVSERDAAILKKDQNAEVVVLALGTDKLKGTIEHINIHPVKERSASNATQYEVTIIITSLITQNDPVFRMGMTAQVHCVFPEEKGMFIPKTAISVKDGRYTVNVLDGQASAERFVELGTISTHQVNVIAGLKQGEQLVLSG